VMQSSPVIFDSEQDKQDYVKAQRARHEHLKKLRNNSAGNKTLG
jgi:hypothetical protein